MTLRSTEKKYTKKRFAWKKYIVHLDTTLELPACSLELQLVGFLIVKLAFLAALAV